MKRFILIALALCVMATSVNLTSGTVHAQTQVAHVSQHVVVAADGWSGYFDDGYYGWGFCLSHNDLQKVGGMLGSTQNITNYLVALAAFGAAGPELGVIAAAIPANYQMMVWTDSNGRGMCMAWLFSYILTAWPQ